MTLARLLRIVRQRLRSIVRRGRQDADLDRELAFHLEALAREKIADGLSPEAARAAARRDFGNRTLFEEQSRDARGIRWLHDAAQDLRFGWRMLRVHRGLTTMAVASLAVGIGANAAVIGAMRAVLIEPLPFAAADRLVAIRAVPPGGSGSNSGTLTDYFAWKERTVSFETVGASMSAPHELGADVGGAIAERVAGQAMTPSLLAMLGVAAERGQLFGEAASAFSPDARVVVISHRLWLRRYGGAADVIGRTIPFDRGTRTIAGVMPADFKYQDDNVDCWFPLIPGPNARRDPGAGRVLAVTARLRPRVTLAEAQRDLDRVAADLAREYPDRFRGWTVRVTPLREVMYGWTRPGLYTLAGAVAVLLALACANVAGLLIARASARQRELWVRVSLGAGRSRLVRQLLTESVLLAVAGGGCGAGIAVVALRALSTAMGPPPGVPRLGTPAFDMALVVVTLALVMLSALGVGVLPAIAATRDAANRPDARQDGRGTMTDRCGPRHRAILVGAQIAMAAVLLVGAGLLFNSFLRLTHRDLNFDPDGLMSFDYSIAVPEYARAVGQTDGFPTFAIAPVASQTIGRVYDRLRAIPTVEAVAGISYPPVNSLIVPRFDAWPDAVGGAPPSSADAIVVAHFLVTPGFFGAVHTPIVRGREFRSDDRQDAPRVVVINEAAARRFWPGGDPIGRRIRLDFGPGEPPREVIGVVRDIPVSRKAASEPIVYGAILQPPSTFHGPFVNTLGQMTFLLRASGAAAALLSRAREAVAEIDPAAPLVNVGGVTRAFEARMPESRNYSVTLLLFSVAALLLAAMGVYGVTAFAVTQRAREVGIRRALGAGSADVLRVVGGRTMFVIAAGLAAGLSIALGLSRLIATQLWGIAPTDPPTFATAAAVLLVIALVACLVPTRRALAVDPVIVLRDE